MLDSRFGPLGLGLGTFAGLCGAVKPAATGFDDLHLTSRVKLYSPRETPLQGIAAVVARWSG